MANAWILRTGSDDLDTLQLAASVVAVGWGVAGDLSGCRTPDEIREHLAPSGFDVDPKRAESLVFQLLAFVQRIQPGDLIVSPRNTTPGIAIAEVTGPYLYRADLAPQGLHVRAARWLRDDVPRRMIGKDLLDGSPLNAVSKIKHVDAVERIRHLVRHGQDKAIAEVSSNSGPNTFGADGTLSAIDNLKRNLEYARSLAEAGDI